ncbi:hypothetical protein [Antrihabitans sp. YC2-6]|nr:hypothetical protein [Antrihabitans sp. YC2-6]
MTDNETGAEPPRSWFTEDWAAVIAGLTLIALVFIGLIPAGVIP